MGATGQVSITAANTGDVINITGGSATLAALGITNPLGYPVNQTVSQADRLPPMTPVNMQFRWAKIDTAALGAGHTDKWNLFYQVNSNATNTQAAWINAGTNFVFDASGQLSPPINSVMLNGVVVDGITLGNVNLSLGANGLTQFANANGTVQVNLMDQKGSPAGQLQLVAVDDQGRIVGTYSNGRIIPLANVTLANFNGQNYLKSLDGGAYAETADSGPAIQNATGKIVGSSLEASNADIADELSKLIVTQQAYSTKYAHHYKH